MFKIQQLTVSDPQSMQPTVELVIAKSDDLENETEYLSACVKIQRKGQSLENISHQAIQAISNLLEQASDEVQKASAEIQKQSLIRN